ncbi:TPA: hypothetical protein N0F65_002924 [Lagenidium giganteum]|uniref:MMS19 nucleotide excision repair protein n=1 Tax=Lagenidium giganteum TaxID=4803 RepID=A0AAV2Z4D7_9STRA|nr:TPA: hypothetical protein N0F65_002924 [Lagenidium giganteum]
MFSLDAPLAPAIAAFVNPENNDAVHKTSLNTIVMQVHRNVAIETLIQELGPSLTATDDKTRARATLLLAEVLTRLPELPLQTTALDLLVNFFSDRLADYPSVSACLQALTALETHHTRLAPKKKKVLATTAVIRADTTVALVLKMLQVLHVPQLSQALRKRCFELLQLALDQAEVCALLVKPEAVGDSAAVGDNTASENGSTAVPTGLAFARGFLNAMEGEKDPRNLLLCLKVARELTQKLEPVFAQHDALLLQLFDVVSCYFPITFTPPPNDPYGITSEELILSLRRAFAASDLLAKHVLPFLLDKLSSTVVEAKLDALETLVFCCEAYSINAMLLHLTGISSGLYHEVVKGDKKEVIESALSAIARFSGAIGRAKTGKAAGGASYAWNKFVVELTQRAIDDLANNAADSLISVSAGPVLAALGKESSLSFAHVLEKAIPLLTKQFQDTFAGSSSQCEAALARLLLLVNTIDREVDQSADAQPMRPHAPALIEVLVSFLGNTTTPASTSCSKRLAVEALCHLITYPPSAIVELNQVQGLVELFTRLLLEDRCKDVRKECLLSLRAASTVRHKSAAKQYAGLVMDLCLNQLMDVIQLRPNDPRIEGILKSSEREYEVLFQDLLDAVTDLSGEASIFQATIARLVELCLQGESAAASCFLESSATTAHHAGKIMQAVARIVELNAEDKESMEFCVTSDAEQSMVFRLLRAIATTAATAASKNELVDEPILTSCTRIFRTTMQSVSAETQQLFANATIATFLSTEAYSAAGAASSSFHPSYLQLVPLFSAVINSASRSVVLPEISQVINRLLELAQSVAAAPPATDATHQGIQTICSDAALSAAKSLASIINKMSDGEEFDALINLLLESKLSKILVDEQEELSVRVVALQIYVWIAKALVIRGHRVHAPTCLQFLCQFIAPSTDTSATDTSHLRMEVAKSFKLLVTEHPDVLNRKCGASITLLYRQRMFDLVFPALLSYIQTHSSTDNVAPLVALSHVISNSPKAVYTPHMVTIFPLMVQAINSDNIELGSSAIKTFRTLLFESTESVKPFLKDVFPGVLRQAQLAYGALDRTAALDCLVKLAQIPYELVHPYKDTVLRILLVCLNDRKRFVRHAAVRVRNQWSIL